MTKLFIVLFTIISMLHAFLFAALPPESLSPEKPDKMLLIFSTDVSYASRVELSSGFFDTLHKENRSYRVEILEFNSQEGHDSQNWKQKMRLFLPLIKSGEYKVIIVFDDVTARILELYLAEIPDETAVIISNVTKVKDEWRDAHSNLTSVIRSIDPVENIKFAESLFPQMDGLVLFTSSNIWDEKRTDELREILNNRYPVRVVYIENGEMSEDEIRTNLLNISANSVAVSFGWDMFFPDDSSKCQMWERLKKIYHGPVFVRRKMLLTFGVGGVILDLSDVGKLTAELTGKIFDGSSAGDIPAVYCPEEYFINYENFREFEETAKNFAEKVVVVGAPEAFTARYRFEIIVTIIVFAALLVFIAGVWLFLFKYRKAARVAAMNSEMLYDSCYHSNMEFYCLNWKNFEIRPLSTLHQYFSEGEKNGGSSFKRRIHPDDRSEVDKVIEQFSRGQIGEAIVEFRAEREDKYDSYIAYCRKPKQFSTLVRECCIIILVQNVTRIREAERDFHDASLMLQTVMDSIPFPIYTKDVANDFRYATCNRGMIELLSGVSPLGKNDFELIGKSIGEDFRVHDIEAISAAGKSLTFSERFELSDSSQLYYNSLKRQIRLSDGREMLFGISTNVTSEEELRRVEKETQRLMSAIIDALPNIAYVKEYIGEKSRLICVNCSLAALYGVEKSELIGRDFSDFSAFNQEQSERICRLDRAIVDSGQAYESDDVFVDCSGRKRYIHITRIAVNGGSGRKYLIGLDVDETNLVESQLRAILDNIPAGVYVKAVDDNMRYLIWNKTLERELNIAGMEIIGRNDFEVESFKGSAELIAASDKRVLSSPGIVCEADNSLFGIESDSSYHTYKTMLRVNSDRALLLGFCVNVTPQMKQEVEYAKTIETLNNHAKNSQIINQCLQCMVAESDPNVAMIHVLEVICLNTGADRGYFCEYRSDSLVVDCKYEWVRPGVKSLKSDWQNMAVDSYKSIHHRFMKNMAAYAEDTDKLPEEFSTMSQVLKLYGIRSFLTIGLYENEKLVGFLGIDYVDMKVESAFTERDIQMLRDTGNLFIISQARQRKENDVHSSLAAVNRQQQIFLAQDSTVNDCLAVLSLGLGLDETLNIVVDKVGGALEADTCNIFRFGNDGEFYVELLNSWTPSGTSGLVKKFEKIYYNDSPYTIKELLAGNSIYVNIAAEYDGEHEKSAKAIAEYMKRVNKSEAINCPIYHKKEIWGYIGTDKNVAKDVFKEGLRMIEAAAKIVSVILEYDDNRRQIAHSELEKSMILGMLPVPVLLYDREVKIISANAAALSIIGKNLDNVAGKLCSMNYCGSERPGDGCIVLKTIQTEQPQNLEVVMRDKTYLVATRPVFEDGKLTGILKCMSDMTDMNRSRELLKEAAQNAEEAARAKSLFLATMSHEIRTPLNAVIGFSGLLLDSGCTEDEKKEYVSSINLAGTALLNLINDILDLSKIEAEQMTPVEDECDFVSLLKEVSSIFSHQLLAKKLEFSLDFPPDMPRIFVDVRGIRQVLLNLIGNAVKFTNSGGIRIEIEFFGRSVLSGDLIIRMSDTGVGISKECQSQIFEPFVQDERIRGTRTESGTGLGLPIAKRLVDRMGGTLSLVSEAGEGTTFIIKLPHRKIVYRKIGAAKIAAKEVLTDEQDVRTGVKLLLVDDVAMNLRLLESLAKRFKCICRTAGNGADALDIMADFMPDWVLTDVWMPVMNGVELAAAIREKPMYNGVKIAIVTADSEVNNNFDTSKLDGVLLKPISQENLKKLLLIDQKK